MKYENLLDLKISKHKSILANRRLLHLSFVGVLVCFFQLASIAGEPLQNEENVRAILEFERSVEKPGKYAETIAGIPGILKEQVYKKVLQGGSFHVPVNQLGRVLQKKKVKRIFQDTRFEFTGQTATSNMKRINAAPSESYPDHGDVNVAILDTGIDSDHPDLKKNIKTGTSVIGDS